MVKTTADENLEKAQAGIEQAIESLATVVVQRCDGWQDFKSEYKEELSETLHDLITIRDRLAEKI